MFIPAEEHQGCLTVSLFSPYTMQVDGFTHLYTLVLRPDLTYEVKIDGQGIESGSIEYDWNLTSLKKMETSSAESKFWDQAEGDIFQVWAFPRTTLERVCKYPGAGPLLRDWQSG